MSDFDDLLNMDDDYEADLEALFQANRDENRGDRPVNSDEEPQHADEETEQVQRKENRNPQLAQPPRKRRKNHRDVSLQESVKELVQLNLGLMKEVRDLKNSRKQSVDDEAALINAINPFKTRSFQVQFELNTKVLCHLRREETKEAIELLTKRNVVLKLADKDPGILQIVDAREATRELENVSKPLSKDVRDYIKLEHSDGGRKRRVYEGQNSNPHGYVGSSQGVYGQSQRSIPSLLDLNIQNPRFRCYSCGAPGHFSYQCPTKQNGRKQF